MRDLAPTFHWPALARWGAAGLVVAGLHGGAAWWLVTHPFVAPPPLDAVIGLPIDIEMMEVREAAAGPAPEPAVQPVPPVETPPAVAPEPALPEAPAPPSPPAEPPPEPTPDPPPPAPAVQPDKPPPAPKQPDTEDAVVPPPPRRVPPKPKRAAPKPDPRRLAREATERRERRVARPAAADAAPVAAASAPPPSAASSGASVATWRGAVIAHLNAFKPAAPAGASGTARVAFAVDRAGRVVSASLTASSGDDGLDAAAVAMVRRASPVPPPPAELGGRVDLAVPVRFR